MLRASAFTLGRSMRRFAAAADCPLRKTPLHANHVAMGGKMVPFGGWDMPVQYPNGIIESHLHCRCKSRVVALADVSFKLAATPPQ